MADTGKQSPLGVNALSSVLQNKGLYINPKVPRFIGISRTNDEYIWTWWRNNDPSGFNPASPLESTVPGNTAGNDTGKINEDTVLRLLTWAINEGFSRGKYSNYNSLIYIGSDIDASITITNSGWPAGETSPSNQPTTSLYRGICTIPALGNAKPPTYQPYDPANRWNRENPYAGLSAAPANTGWPFSGKDGQKQGASWFPYRAGGANPSITQWGYFRLHYLQAWGEFKYNDPIVTSPYNYLAPYTTASYPPKYKDFCASFLSADAWKNYSNQAIYSMFNSQEFLKGAYSGINDLISGDIAGINTAFTWFGEDLRYLGKAFNVKTIDKFGYPSNLLATIVENNAMTQELALALDAVEISTADIDNFISGSVIPSVEQEKKIYSAFLTIKGQNLEPILRVLGCTTFTFSNGTSQVVEDDAYLTDLLSPVKMFRWSKNSLFIPIYNNNTANIQEAGSKLRIRLFPNGNSVNSELTSAAVTENVGQLITDGSPPIITQDLNTTITEPQKGFNSRLQSIIPRDDAIACTALSYAFSQVTNIQQSDNLNFAQVVKRLEAINLEYLNRVNGTNNYTPVNVPIAQKGHFITSSGSGPHGTFTMSDMFGNMSSLPYPWETIYEKIRQIAWNPGVGNSIGAAQPNAGLFYIYKQLFLALSWDPAIFYIYQWPIDLRKGCNTPYIAGACLNNYQGQKIFGVTEIGSKGLVGINPGMEIKDLGSTTQWTWNYIAGNPLVKTPVKPEPPPVPADAPPMPEPNGPPCYNWNAKANDWGEVDCLPGDPGGPPLDIYEAGQRLEIRRDPNQFGDDIGNGQLYQLFEDPIYYNAPALISDKRPGLQNTERWVIEYPWRGYPFYDTEVRMPRRLTYEFSNELFCDRSITGWGGGGPSTTGGGGPGVGAAPVPGGGGTVNPAAGETAWSPPANPVARTTLTLEKYYATDGIGPAGSPFYAQWTKNIIQIPDTGIALEINMQLYPMLFDQTYHEFNFVEVVGGPDFQGTGPATFEAMISPYPGDFTSPNTSMYGTPVGLSSVGGIVKVWFLTDYWGTQATQKNGQPIIVSSPASTLGTNRLPSGLQKYYLNLRHLGSGTRPLSMVTNFGGTKQYQPSGFDPCVASSILVNQNIPQYIIDKYKNQYAGCGPGTAVATSASTGSRSGSTTCPAFSGTTIVWTGSQLRPSLSPAAITAIEITTERGPGYYYISYVPDPQGIYQGVIRASASTCAGVFGSGRCESTGSGGRLDVILGRPLTARETSLGYFCHIPTMPSSGKIYLNLQVIQPGTSGTKVAVNVSITTTDETASSPPTTFPPNSSKAAFSGETIVWQGSQLRYTELSTSNTTAIEIDTNRYGLGIYIMGWVPEGSGVAGRVKGSASTSPGVITTGTACGTNPSGDLYGTINTVVGRPLTANEVAVGYCSIPTVPSNGKIYLNLQAVTVGITGQTLVDINISHTRENIPSGTTVFATAPAAAAATGTIADTGTPADTGTIAATGTTAATGTRAGPAGVGTPGDLGDIDPVNFEAGGAYDWIFPTRGLRNGGGYLRGNPSAAALTEAAAQFGGPKTEVFPQYRNVSGAGAYVKRMGCFDTTTQSNEYGRFGRLTRFATTGGRVWYYRDKMFNYPDGRSFSTNRYWSSGKYGPGTGGDGPIRPGFPPLNIPPQAEGIYTTASPAGNWMNIQPPFTEIWWNLDPFNGGDPDFLWSNCFLPNEPYAQYVPWRLYIKTQKPPIELLPVTVGASESGTSLSGINVEGDWYTMGGTRAAGSPGVLVREHNPAWENGAIPAAITAYIAQANREIQRIYNARNASNPNDPVNTLNTLYEMCGTQLMIEQRTRYYALPPVPVPYDDFLNAWPTPLYSFVDSLPMLHQDTAPHMTSETLDHISDFSGGSDTLNPIYDSTRHGVLGGQSTIAMGPQERNQQKLAIVGIPLSNNIENYMQPEERMVWTMNNTINQAINNQSTPGGDYVITAWPGNIQPGGEIIAPIPQGRFIERPVPSVTIIPGQLSGTAGTPGPWPQVGTLVVGPGPGPAESIETELPIIETRPGIVPGRDVVIEDERGQRVITTRIDPEVIYDIESPSRKRPIRSRRRLRIVDGEPGSPIINDNPVDENINNPYNPRENSINYPIRLPNFTGGAGNPIGGLGTDGLSPDILTGVGYSSIVPVNLDPFFTGTTTFPSSLSVEQAIAQVIACNCDCFIN